MEKTKAFLLFLVFQNIYSLKDKGQASIPSFMNYDICSYNGYPTILQKINEKNQTISYVKCECNKEFSTVKKNYGFSKIKNFQCNYAKKRISITLLFSVLLPFGLDYFYLGRYIIGTICLLLFLIIFFGKHFFLFQIEQAKSPSVINQSQLSLIKRIFRFSQWLYGVGYIINCFLNGLGLIKDGEGIYQINDLKSFIL